MTAFQRFLPLFCLIGCIVGRHALSISVEQHDDDDDTLILEPPSNAIDEENFEGDPEKDIIDLSFYGQAIYGIPDVESTAKLVANYTPETSPVNPEELGPYLEGDILVPSSTDSGRSFFTKNAVISQSSRWPNAVVPFEIDGGFNARDMSTIQFAMRQYHDRTCIRFVPRTSERDYIVIKSGNSGCWSSVGRVGGRQEVNLQSPGCLSKPGTAMHELMHAVGFLHEQNREERDSFVSIQYRNIQPHAVSNFEKARTNGFGVPYDYGSVMHYSANAFSSNGQPTIIAVQPSGAARMGQRDGFSALDLQKLNSMYNCGAAGVGAVPAPLPVVPPAAGPVAPQPVGQNIIGSFLGGLINGLGLGDENDGKAPSPEPAPKDD